MPQIYDEMIWNWLGKIGRRFRLKATPPSVCAGDLVSVLTDEGEFAIMKILARDRQGVHVRLYVQRFSVRPRALPGENLTTAPFGAEHANPLSIGHLPLSFASFAGWQPQQLAKQDVDEDELEGYRMWQEANGGYF